MFQASRSSEPGIDPTVFCKVVARRQEIEVQVVRKIRSVTRLLHRCYSGVLWVNKGSGRRSPDCAVAVFLLDGGDIVSTVADSRAGEVERPCIVEG